MLFVAPGLPIGLIDDLAQVPQDSDIRIFVLGDIVAAYEHGFSLPPAGGDKQWFRDNFTAFEKKAEEGNVEMKELVEEIKARKLLD